MSGSGHDSLTKMAAAFPACPLCGAGDSFRLSGFRKDKVACGSCGAEWVSPQFGTNADLSELTLNNAGNNQDLRDLVYTGLGIKKSKTPAWWRLARSDPKATAMGEHVAYLLNLAHFQPDPVLRDAATKELEGLGPLGQAEIDGIARGVHFGLQTAALHYLALHGDERWVEILRRDMEIEPGPKARRYPLLDSLGELGRLEALKAAWELSALTGNYTLVARAGQLAEGYVARLAAEVAHGEDKYREEAVRMAIAFSSLTGNEELRLRVIERLAKDRTPSVKVAAARALGAAGPDPRVIDALEAALKDTSSAPQDKILATSWLGVAKAALAEASRERNLTVGEIAEYALARMDDPRALAIVVRRQVEQPGLLIRSIDQSMEFIKAVGPRAIDPLLEAMNSDNPLHAHRAAIFVHSLVEAAPEARAVEPLMRLLLHPDPKVRWWAAAALGVSGDRRAIEPLARMAEGDGELSNQGMARRALAKLQGTS